MLFTKSEVIEMMLRPHSMPKAIHKTIIEDYMHNQPGDLASIFSKETNLRLVPAGNNLFEIKY
jgi:hypothetical protein